jgi:hypothetical protein
VDRHTDASGETARELIQLFNVAIGLFLSRDQMPVRVASTHKSICDSEPGMSKVRKK